MLLSPTATGSTSCREFCWACALLLRRICIPLLLSSSLTSHCEFLRNTFQSPQHPGQLPAAVLVFPDAAATFAPFLCIIVFLGPTSPKICCLPAMFSSGTMPTVHCFEPDGPSAFWRQDPRTLFWILARCLPLWSQMKKWS